MAVRTFGQMISSLDDWAKEPVQRNIARDAINDAIEKIWLRVLQAQLSQFMGGPTTVSLAAGTERTQLVSIPDPLVAPVVNNVVSGALAQHTPTIVYTVVTESGTETLPSPAVAPVIPANSVADVQPPARVPSAFGWNVYAGSSLANLCRQNIAPLEWSVTFTEPDTGFIDAGDDLSPGPRPPTENSTSDDVFYIRRLETQLSTGGYRRWENTGIDSMMFDFASRSLASSSEYQPYYWDLINGRTLEYRPTLGLAFNPRYFFVHKPRRIQFDSAPLPFTAFPSEEAIRSFALAAWKLSEEQMDSARFWQDKGDKALMESCVALRQEDWNKDTTITPYMAGY